ncbi:putative arabinose efflux permease AraJ, MFS family [Cupriavidus necator]|uniref:Arabinose efflux permease n=1 Tax=Cupriavidus necator (strain ATCC 17699 / DSM 428 / KCTC 22496 / NCIMB 10442 / H16 / Stanier 337) TaxID=381666 RepID=Q0K358_CUPNH|nr:MFS transporter [Cupriavidus necator]QCC03465.1 MFS transporter [Cupriavidus necator H16]QQB80521.1 MFS transporter [Cupriavidus necator]WKA44803.1 MFS transporter [Cupriavidus necator]CAJ95566.1 arabinose efflux permease [Cupriavidus necator H16]
MPSPCLLPVLALAVCMVGAAEFMLSPMLAPLADAFATTPARASGLISAYALSYALAAPLMGWFSDRAGRRRVLLAALLLFALDGIALTLVPTLHAAMALRILGGLAAAATIPTVFALIADLVPPARQAGAMGGVMLGMTAGIAAGPAVAGVLADGFGWRAPFLVTAGGCLAALLAGCHVLPRNLPRSGDCQEKSRNIPASSGILLPLIAKGAWNGSAVAAYVLAGEVLRLRYGLGVPGVGAALSVFGLGLAVGNLLAGRASQCFAREESVLIVATALVAVALTLFTTGVLGLPGSLGCLLAWGAALGIAAPSSTAILARRAGAAKGQILAVSESINNLAVLMLMPVAASSLAVHGTVPAALLVGGCCLAGVALAVADRRMTA